MMLELQTEGSSHRFGAGSADHRNKGLQFNIDNVCEYKFIGGKLFDLCTCI